MSDRYPAPHPAAAFEQVEGEFMAEGAGAALFRFVERDETPSATAQRILELSDGRHSISAIVAALAAEFEGASPADIERDVRAFVDELVAQRVLVLLDRPIE